MRAFQFWILLIGSIVITCLLMKQLFLNRAIDAQQRIMIDNEEVAAQSEIFQDKWKELAVTVYTNSHQDPALAAVLKDENVGIRTLPPGTTAATAASEMTNAISTKTPAPPAPTTH